MDVCAPYCVWSRGPVERDDRHIKTEGALDASLLATMNT